MQDGALGAIQELADAAAGAVGVVLIAAIETLLYNVVRGVDQAAQHTLVLHDARVMLGVDGAGQAVGQGGKIGHAADRFQLLLASNSSVSVV